MDPHKTNWLFGIITIGAIGFAVFSYTSNTNTANPTITSSIFPTASQTPRASELPSPSPTVTASASSTTTSPSPTTSTATRTFSASAGLSQPNQIEKIDTGGSLFAIAQANEITVNDLAKINGITDVNTVFAGQSIIVPDDVTGKNYTILFVINTARQAKEKKKIDAGGTSLYTDALTAAQTDTKGIYGLKSDTPYSKADETETGVTLTTTDGDRIITLTMSRGADTLWIIKKLIIKSTGGSE